jgi:hypothetical protein
VAVTPPSGNILVATGFDIATNGTFVAFYERQSNGSVGNHSYSLTQVLEIPNAIPDPDKLYRDATLQACPIQISSDGLVVAWGWSSYNLDFTLPLGAVYVAYLDSDTGLYALSQTLTDPGFRYNRSLTVKGLFGTSVIMSMDYRMLMISSLNLNYLELSNPPNCTVYVYALAEGGTAWPPTFEFSAQNNISQQFCTACDDGNEFGYALASDALFNGIAVGAPLDGHYENGSVYFYVQKQGYGASDPKYAEFVPAGSVASRLPDAYFGAAISISPDYYNILVGAPYANSNTGGTYYYNLTQSQSAPFADTRGMQSLFDPNIDPNYNQGVTVAISVGTGNAIAVVASPYVQSETTGGILTIYEALALVDGGDYVIIEEVGPFGPVYAEQRASGNFTTVGCTSTVVSWDGRFLAAGGPGCNLENPAALSPGSVYVWANDSGSELPVTEAPVSCNLYGLIGGVEIPCYAEPDNGEGFDILEYLEDNPAADPCRNATSGLGRVQGFVSWPSGFVTPNGTLHGNDQATCGQYMASVAVYVYCSADAGWDCAIPAALNVTRVAAVASTRGSIRAVRDNVFFLYNPADVPSANSQPLNAGGIISIVVGAVAVVSIASIIGLQLRSTQRAKFAVA